MLSICDASYYVTPDLVNLETQHKLLNIALSQVRALKRICNFEWLSIINDVASAELLQIPITQLLQRHNNLGNEVKYLIHAHTMRAITPFGNSVIRHANAQCNLTNATAFGVSMFRCVSLFKAMELATNLLAAADDQDKAIIVTGEIISAVKYRTEEGLIVIGDAAAALLVAKTAAHNNLRGLAIAADGRFAKGLWLTQDEISQLAISLPKLVAQVVQQALAQAGIELKQVKALCPHHAGLHLWRRYAKEIGIPLSKVYLANTNRYGHCFGSDLIINCTDLFASGLLNRGDYYLMVTTGNGGYAAAAVFQY